MSEPSPKLFRPWPPHVERDLRLVAWELDHVKEVVQDHQDRLAAPPSPTKGLLQPLSTPIALVVLAMLAILDPKAAFSLGVKMLGLVSW
jgi:hypothetical protein